MEHDFSFETCKNAVKYYIEFLHENPIRLLGEFVLRAEQDITFNKTMIDALKEYIKENNIKWNNK